MEGVCLNLMLHIHVWCGLGNYAEKKNTPITLLLVRSWRSTFCASEFHFMYDSFFLLHFYHAGPVCQMFQGAGQMVTGFVIATVKQANANAHCSDFEQAYHITLFNVHIDYL